MNNSIFKDGYFNKRNQSFIKMELDLDHNDINRIKKYRWFAPRYTRKKTQTAGVRNPYVVYQIFHPFYISDIDADARKKLISGLRTVLKKDTYIVSYTRQTHEVIMLRNTDNPMVMDRLKEIFEPFQSDADKMMKELGDNIDNRLDTRVCS